jgi:hypothetical protein
MVPVVPSQNDTTSFGPGVHFIMKRMNPFRFITMLPSGSAYGQMFQKVTLSASAARAYS